MRLRGKRQSRVVLVIQESAQKLLLRSQDGKQRLDCRAARGRQTSPSRLALQAKSLHAAPKSRNYSDRERRARQKNNEFGEDTYEELPAERDTLCPRGINWLGNLLAKKIE